MRVNLTEIMPQIPFPAPRTAPLASPDGEASPLSAEARQREAILRDLVDVYLLRPHHAMSETARFEEIASGLIDHASPALCAEIAARLVDHPRAPTGLLEKLARLSEEAAARVYGSTRPVSHARIAAAATWGPERVAIAVASRIDLDATLVAALAMRPERAIAIALAANPHALLGDHELRALASRAREDDALAAALLPRLKGEEAATLFLQANRDQRNATIAAAMRRDLAAPLARPACALDAAAIPELQKAAVEADLDRAAAILAGSLGLREAPLVRALGDESGEPIALLLSALSLPTELRERLLVFLAPGWGEGYWRFERLRKLAAACPPATARRLLGAMAGYAAAGGSRERRAASTDATLAARAIAGRDARAVTPDAEKKRG